MQQCDEIKNGQNLFKNLYELYKNKNNCDLKIICEDGHIFNIHSCIVLTKIPRIREKILNKQPDRCVNFTIKFPIKSEVFENIIQFAYLNTWEIDNIQMCIELLRATFYLNMSDALNACINYLKNNMDSHTAVFLVEFQVQDISIPQEAMDICKTFILRNMLVNPMENNSPYLNISSEKFKSYLRDDKLHAPYEEAAWYTSLKWIEHDISSRLRELPSIIKTLRIGMMDKEFINDKIRQHNFVMGNEEIVEYLNEVEACISNTNMTETLPISLQPRIPHTVIINTGGILGSDTRNLTDVTEVYDHLADCWIQVPELKLPIPLAYHKLVFLHGELIVLGGISASERVRGVKSCWRFDMNSYQWLPLRHMLYARSHMCAGIVDGQLYAVGGRSTVQHRWVTAEIYDHVAKVWSTLHNLEGPRSDAAAAVSHGMLYVVGGYNGFMVVRSVDCYNVQLKMWISCVPLNKPRSGLSCISHGDFIYAIGGWDGRNRLNCLERYDPQTREWTFLSPMIAARSNMSAVCFDDKIFVFGGYCIETAISDGEIYDIFQDRWYPATNMTQIKSGCASCVVDDITFSSRVLSAIATRNDPNLFRNPIIKRSAFIIDRENIQLPRGIRSIEPAFIGPLIPIPWHNLFSADSDTEDDTVTELNTSE